MDTHTLLAVYMVERMLEASESDAPDAGTVAEELKHIAALAADPEALKRVLEGSGESDA